MKKALSILLAVVMVMCALPFSLTASAEVTSGTTGDCTWTLDGTVLTISGNGEMEDYYNDLPWGTSITSVIIEDGVTCIGSYAFSGCDGLTSIKVEEGNTVYHSKNNCIIETKSKTLIFGCKNSVIPTDGSVTSIGASAFYGCTGLASITIPNSITFISVWAFENCTGLTSITIDEGVTTIGEHAFSFCTGLTSVTIPNSVTSIRDNAFSGCTGLTSVTIPNSVTSIGSSAFSGCTRLTNITIPNSVTSIGECAFCYCTGLTSITIPDSVTSIGDYAFYRCNNIINIYYEGSESDWLNIEVYDGNEALLNATIHYNYVPVPEIKYGLVTENEEVSATDALAVLHAVVGKVEFTDAQKTAGDVNGDGEINATDALTILHFVVGKITKFPVEQ